MEGHCKSVGASLLASTDPASEFPFPNPPGVPKPCFSAPRAGRPSTMTCSSSCLLCRRLRLPPAPAACRRASWRPSRCLCCPPRSLLSCLRQRIRVREGGDTAQWGCMQPVEAESNRQAPTLLARASITILVAPSSCTGTPIKLPEPASVHNLKKRLSVMDLDAVGMLSQRLGLRLGALAALVRILELRVEELEGVGGTGSLEQDRQLLLERQADDEAGRRRRACTVYRYDVLTISTVRIGRTTASQNLRGRQGDMTHVCIPVRATQLSPWRRTFAFCKPVLDEPSSTSCRPHAGTSRSASPGTIWCWRGASCKTSWRPCRTSRTGRSSCC